MRPSEPYQPRHDSEHLDQLELRLGSRSDAMSQHSMPKDWEVVEVHTPRPAWCFLWFFKILAKYRWCRRVLQFQSFGRGSSLAKPYWVRGAASISIGNRVTIWRAARLTAVNASTNETKIIIGAGSSIHPYVHISAASRVTIGENVLFAANCYVTDHDHDWLNPGEPPRTNKRLLTKPTSIGSYTWLGERVAVMKGVQIGEHCVIGANSVVTCDIPSYSVAVGSPARVIRRWDRDLKAWIQVE